MTRYTATIRHHSIASARIVPVGDDLTTAKRNATREFGGDFNDYLIVILDRDASNFDSEIVARKRIGSRKWSDLH